MAGGWRLLSLHEHKRTANLRRGSESPAPGSRGNRRAAFGQSRGQSRPQGGQGLENPDSPSQCRDSIRPSQGTSGPGGYAGCGPSHFMRPVVYHCEADVELVGAAKYYECQREQLGHRFLRAVHVALARIQEKPEGFPFYEGYARACRVAGFPYRLVYEVLPDAICIIAVAHMSREPGFWRNRLS